MLATSGSNIAVDNLVEGLVKEGIKVVRALAELSKIARKVEISI